LAVSQRKNIFIGKGEKIDSWMDIWTDEALLNFFAFGQMPNAEGKKPIYNYFIIYRK